MRKLVMAAALAVVLGAGVAPPAQAQFNLNIPVVTPLTQAQIDARQLYTIGKAVKGLTPTATQLANGNQTLPVALNYIAAHKLATIDKRMLFLSKMTSPAGCTITFKEGDQGTFGFASLAALNASVSTVRGILVCPPSIYSAYTPNRRNFIDAIRKNPLLANWQTQHMIAFAFAYSQDMYDRRKDILNIIFTPPSVDITWPNNNNN